VQLVEGRQLGKWIAFMKNGGFLSKLLGFSHPIFVGE